MKPSRFAVLLQSKQRLNLDNVYGEEDVVEVPVSKDGVELLAGIRQDGESAMAMIAFNDYVRMGPGRSQAGLRRKYMSMIDDADPSSSSKVPTVSLNTLRNWSSDYGWAARAELYDASFDRSKTDTALEVLGIGLSLAHNRILALKRLASKLESDIESRLWTKDVKSLSKDDYVELLRLNGKLLREYRGVLDDIAKETGGRVRSVELSGANGGPIGIDFGDAARNALVSRLLQDASSLDEEATPGGNDD